MNQPSGEATTEEQREAQDLARTVDELMMRVDYLAERVATLEAWAQSQDPGEETAEVIT